MGDRIHHSVLGAASLTIIPRRLSTAALAGLLLVGIQRGAARHQLAVTFDDLPGDENLDSASLQTMTDGILSALQSHDVPAVGFVTGKLVLVHGQVDERIEMLDRWMEAGATLGNHSFSHDRLSKIALEEYEADVIKGDVFPAYQMTGRAEKPRYFRPPANDLGPTLEVHDALREFLETLDYVLVPFTIENEDYMFNSAFLHAKRHRDTETAETVMTAYLEQVDLAFEFFEELSAKMFKRQIPQILLIHANQLNAEALGEIFSKLEHRGYEFVSLEQALRDPAYSTPDEYEGSAGISWLHRWSLSLGYGTRETPSGRTLPKTLWGEPDPPDFIVKLADRSP